MKKVNSFIADLERLKIKMNKGPENLTDLNKFSILKERQRKLERKRIQIHYEIENEFDALFSFVETAQAGIETLQKIDTFALEEIQKIEGILRDFVFKGVPDILPK